MLYILIELTFLKEINKTSESKECDICHNWNFLNKGFKFQPDVCNGCHDLLTMSMNFSGIAILNIKGLIIVVLLAELPKVRP